MTTPMPPIGPVERWVLVALLGARLALSLVGLDWGIEPETGSQLAFDELMPGQSGFVVDDHSRGRYPPLHYHVLTLVHASVLALPSAALADGMSRRAVLLLSSRAVSALLGCATVALVWLLARRLWRRPGPALFAAGTVASLPVFDFYTRTANLEVPYVFWFTCALVSFERLCSRHRLRDYAWFGFMAICSVTTKDQAGGLFILPMLALPVLLALDRHPSRRGLAALAVLRDRRLVVVVLVVVGGFVVVHNLLFDWGGFLLHLRTLAARNVAREAVGDLPLLGGPLHHLLWVLGVPLALATIAGGVDAWRSGSRRPFLFLLFPVSYYVFFLVPRPVSFDRYLLPVAVVAALWSGRGLWLLASREGRRPVFRRLVLAAVVVWSVAKLALLAATLTRDSRQQVGTWAREARDRGERVVAVGTMGKWSVRGTDWEWLWPLYAGGGEAVAELDADYVVLNRRELRGFGLEDWLRLFTDGWFGYEVEATVHASPGFDRLLWAGILSAPGELNPPMLVLRRTGDVRLYRGRVRRRVQELWRTGEDGWQRLGEEIVSAPLLGGRTSHAPGMVAFDLYEDRWTIGTMPAVIVVQGAASAARSPTLVIGRGSRAAPTRVEVRRDGHRDVLDVVPERPVRLRLPDLPPNGRTVVAIAARDDWSLGGGEREIGVRVRLVLEPAGAER